MSRILLAWELGSNLGHLSRLLPIAVQLRERGHEVLVAVRDVGLATEILSAAGVPFVQAPRWGGAPLDERCPSGYAEVLLLQGWENSTWLWGAVQAWGNILRLFRASAVVVDYSPAALLTARVMGIPRAVLGTGFELPPLEAPFPLFPGALSASTSQDGVAETRVLASANEVLQAYGARRLEALRDLFQTEGRWLTTFAELDQYGARAQETYVGPIGSLDRAQSTAWPKGFAHRVLAYLRPNTPAMAEILRVLASRSDTAVICAVPGLSLESLSPVTRDGFRLFSHPVNFAPLLAKASLFVSYGPAASVTQSLLKGVPQLLAPTHIEAQMTALRVLAMGAGLMLGSDSTEEVISGALDRLLSDSRFKVRASEFAARYREFESAQAVDRMVTDIEALAAGAQHKRASAG